MPDQPTIRFSDERLRNLRDFAGERLVSDLAAKVLELRQKLSTARDALAGYHLLIEGDPHDGDSDRSTGTLDGKAGGSSPRPRVIDNPEDLDALPIRSVVLDRNQDVWQACGRGQWSVMFGAATGSARRVLVRGGVTILWTPGGER